MEEHEIHLSQATCPGPSARASASAGGVAPNLAQIICCTRHLLHTGSGMSRTRCGCYETSRMAQAVQATAKFCVGAAMAKAAPHTPAPEGSVMLSKLSFAMLAGVLLMSSAAHADDAACKVLRVAGKGARHLNVTVTGYNFSSDTPDIYGSGKEVCIPGARRDGERPARHALYAGFHSACRIDSCAALGLAGDRHARARGRGWRGEG